MRRAPRRGDVRSRHSVCAMKVPSSVLRQCGGNTPCQWECGVGVERKNVTTVHDGVAAGSSCAGSPSEGFGARSAQQLAPRMCNDQFRVSVGAGTPCQWECGVGGAGRKEPLRGGREQVGATSAACHCRVHSLSLRVVRTPPSQ